jgi:pyridoxamine 5'-phosphate oxidase family protein
VQDSFIVFTEKEIAYLKSQPLARIATVSTSGQPDNSATTFEFDGEVFYLGSLGDLRQSRRGKSVLAGNTKVALVVDDLETMDPWKPRSIRIYGTAEFVERDGRFGHKHYMRITPTISWSTNIEPTEYVGGRPTYHRTVHR